MTFSNAVKNYSNEAVARTDNGMKARATSASKVHDIFGKIGSARKVDISSDFVAALAENEELTIRTLLWSRDIRAGAGERKTFRDLLVKLEAFNPGLAGRLMPKIPFLGRWDDIFAYRDPLNKVQAYGMIRAALEAGDGLCAKWMPRKGSIAVALTKFLGVTPKEYRKLIVGLTKVVETQMCAKEWDKINFSHVPSVASARYQKAFGRNASEAYSAYIRELQKPVEQRDPKVKINAAAVYPYDVVKSSATGNVAVADAQWDALPNYVGDAKIFPMVDTSGSMGSLRHNSYGYGISTIQPIEISTSLGLYLSEKNTGPFKDMFMIFDSTPKLVVAKGTLSQRLGFMKEIVAGSTNLHAAFDMLLDVAVKGKVKAEDMPEILLIITDMQFDSCVRFDDSAKQMIERKYNNAGYAVPKIVFWNVNAQGKSTPIRFDDKGTCLVSGFSPSILTSVLGNDMENYTPINVMLKTITNERYDY